MKIYPKPSKNHIYYNYVNDWIEWDENDYEIMEKDGGSAYGFIRGKGITGKNYTGYISFIYEGGGSWEPDISSISDVEEA